MKIRKDDKVIIIAGKDKGKNGKVTKVLPDENKVVVEGLNIVKKRVRPRKEGQKGQIIQMAHPLNVSNVKLVCGSCGQPARVGYRLADKKEGKNKKTRICKKCQAET